MVTGALKVANCLVPIFPLQFPSIFVLALSPLSTWHSLSQFYPPVKRNCFRRVVYPPSDIHFDMRSALCSQASRAHFFRQSGSVPQARVFRESRVYNSLRLNIVVTIEISICKYSQLKINWKYVATQKVEIGKVNVKLKTRLIVRLLHWNY